MPPHVKGVQAIVRIFSVCTTETQNTKTAMTC